MKDIKENETVICCLFTSDPGKKVEYETSFNRLDDLREEKITDILPRLPSASVDEGWF